MNAVAVATVGEFESNLAGGPLPVTAPCVDELDELDDLDRQAGRRRAGALKQSFSDDLDALGAVAVVPLRERLASYSRLGSDVGDGTSIIFDRCHQAQSYSGVSGEVRWANGFLTVDGYLDTTRRAGQEPVLSSGLDASNVPADAVLTAELNIKAIK